MRLILSEENIRRNSLIISHWKISIVHNRATTRFALFFFPSPSPSPSNDRRKSARTPGTSDRRPLWSGSMAMAGLLSTLASSMLGMDEKVAYQRYNVPGIILGPFEAPINYVQRIKASTFFFLASFVHRLASLYFRSFHYVALASFLFSLFSISEFSFFFFFVVCIDTIFECVTFSFSLSLSFLKFCYRFSIFSILFLFRFIHRYFWMS